MRIAAMALGILGGLVGAFGAYGASATGAIAGEIVMWGLLCSLMAIVGGGITLARPAVAGTLMLLSGIGGFGAAVRVFIFDIGCWPEISFVMFYFIASLLLIPGGALATRKKRPREGRATILRDSFVLTTNMSYEGWMIRLQR